MRLLDLSQPIWHECPNCPTHPLVESKIIADHEPDEWRMEHLHLASHTGSHIDAPLHKLANSPSLDDMPLETFVGPAFIADLRHLGADAPIDGDVLQSCLSGDLRDKIILLATGWGDKRARNDEWFYHAPFLSSDGATWLREQQVRGVGIDHYSVGGAQEPRNGNTHAILLGSGIWIVEELRFSDEVMALPQPVQFWALPVNLKAHSGAWCRPVVVVES
jgi:kynurenine formamidase